MQPASSKMSTKGGGFLLESTDRIFTPEQFTEEQKRSLEQPRSFGTMKSSPNSKQSSIRSLVLPRPYCANRQTWG